MTPDDAKKIIQKYCDDVYERKGLGLFVHGQDRKIELYITKILQPWEKDANLSLPAKITLAEGHNSVLNKEGLHYSSQVIPWNEMVLTVIAEHFVGRGRDENFRKEGDYFMCCLRDGRVIEKEIAKGFNYSNLLGHFVELYKQI
jgi:hypothetical protein